MIKKEMVGDQASSRKSRNRNRNRMVIETGVVRNNKSIESRKSKMRMIKSNRIKTTKLRENDHLNIIQNYYLQIQAVQFQKDTIICTQQKYQLSINNIYLALKRRMNGYPEFREFMIIKEKRNQFVEPTNCNYAWQKAAWQQEPSYQGAWKQGDSEQNSYKQASNWDQVGGGWGASFVGKESLERWGNNLNGCQWVQEQKHRNKFDIKNLEDSNNFNNFKENQVINIEPSPELEEIKKLGGIPFLDSSFPPTQQSLTGEYGKKYEWRSVKWVKITQKMKNPALFHGKIQASDIKQGALGDCYFLAGLAALAERPDRIFSLFLTQEMNKQRYFGVKILFRGKWRRIILDEYIPWSGTQPAFSRTNQDQLWVVLLQKAWAKLYTSYKRIQSGVPQQPLHDLTGAPMRVIALQDKNLKKDMEWQYLVEASRREYAMIASSNSTKSGQDTQKSNIEVILNHAYTLLNVRTINIDNKPYQIVQLRNPHGQSQPKGKWNDNDPLWEKISPQQKQRIGYKKNSNDGFFFMDYDQFLQEFSHVTVAEIDDNASYVYKCFKDLQVKGAYFTIDIFANGLYSFQVDKPPNRIYPENLRKQYKYPKAQLKVGRLQGNQMKIPCDYLSIYNRTLCKKLDLTPGRYFAFVKIHFDRDYEDQYDVTLAIYAPTACKIRLATSQQAAIFDPSAQWTGIQAKMNW